MIKTEKLPEDMLIDLNNNGKRDCEVKKTVLEDIEEVQCLEVGPNLIIRTHKHIKNGRYGYGLLEDRHIYVPKEDNMLY